MMELLHSLRVECVPPTTTTQTDLRSVRRKDGKLGVINTHRAQHNWLVWAHQHKPREVFDGPLGFIIDLEWPWSNSKHDKKTRLKWLRFPRDTRPDCDNVAKGILDAIVSAQWCVSDARIAGLVVSEWWGHNPGVTLAMYRMVGVPMPGEGGVADILGYKHIPPPPPPVESLTFDQSVSMFLEGHHPDQL
jgi:Holliday junction resolvase RusA-like endonuclease